MAIFARIVSVAYVLAGIAGGIWPGHWDESNAIDQIMWVVLLVGGGLLIFAGLRVFGRSPWGGAALVSLGAVAGALVLFWTIIVLAAALALIIVSVISARRMTGTPPVPD